ncbi:MAG: nSTAND1 domain-containing NTPase [Mycobacteriales bacterium]
MTQHTAESRTVTRAFLIADIRGYTAFTRTHGDEAAGQLAGTFAALARLAVTARCGKVLELRGDEVLAVFEDAAQAARAAVELQAICSEDADKSPAGFGFPVGIGLDHGEVVPIEDGYRGAAINLAARLCSKAAAGEVLATQKLLDLTGEIDIAHCEEREPVEVKGYAEPVAIAALSLRPTGTPTTSSRGPLPAELDSFVPHVGRDDELNWLVGTWRQARRGRGRIVVISGEGGIGKTRIAAEAASRADAARVVYAGGGGAGAAVMSAAIHTACHADVPTLAILDDLQHYPDAVDSLLTLADAIESRPTLIVALVRDAGSSREISELTSRINTRGDGWRDLEPLDIEVARAIVALYAGDELADAPIESMTRASGGNPGRLHEVASDWARDEARRRLSAAAEWIAESRAKQSSGLTFANNVIALRLGRMFAERSDLASDLCPYKGLAPFEPTDAAYFYGREKLVGDLAARSVGAGMLAVVGPSGSGKSSVVMAGLLPSLAGGLLPGSDRWVQQVIRPGSQPMKALSAVLPQQRNDRLVLVVDQFEETFTSCENVAEQADFIARLVDLAHDPDRHIVVVTIRADFTGHCTPWPELSQLIADNLVLVGPMTDDELHRAIELPARRVGLRVESSLADALVSEVSDEPGGLPLLSTALVELWQGRDDGWLRYRTYEATGGVRAAVARLAEASYSQLSAHEQEIARSLLLRLVGEGEGDAAVRRRAPLNEFDDEPAVVAILTRLTEDRLLTRDDDHIEIAHEALIREWPRFRGWLDEDATGRQLRQHITQAAKTWSERGEDDADLYRGARLSATLDWSAAHLRDLNQLERSFLERSRQASVRDADKQRRTNRRLRGLLAGTALFLVVALIAGILAVVQRGHARTAQTAAEAQALTSDS